MNLIVNNTTIDEYLNFINLLNKNDLFNQKEVQELYNLSNFTLENLDYVLKIFNICCTTSFSYELKSINSFCIIYTKCGKGILNYNNASYLLKDNSIIFFDCSISHRISHIKDTPWDFEIIFFNGSNTKNFYKNYSFDKSLLYFLPPASTTPNNIELIKNYCISPSQYSELIISNLLNTILTNILIDKQKIENSDVCIPKYIKEIQTLFDNHYTDSYSLDQLSLKYNINKYKLVRDFTKYISKPPIEYVILKKIDAAKLMLISTKLTIHDISESIGIENVNHFINLFKKHTGVSPLTYRKQYT